MKIVHVALITNSSPQFALRDALRNNSTSYTELNWQADPSPNESLKRICAEIRPELVFMQIQTGGIISLDTLRTIKQYCGKIVNWTGDVRKPTPRWYFETGKEIDITLFTNDSDVEELRREGIIADYLQIGYDQNIYCSHGYVSDKPDIVFMGNNYGDMFPLSSMRLDLVKKLYARFGDKFRVCGSNWPIPGTNVTNAEQEAMVYRGSKIAINFSHFDLSRYSSDRLFRIMGCGPLCLSHNYKNIKMEFYPGCHLDIWDTIDELISKIEFYLSHEQIRKVIAKQGEELVRHTCTWEHRIRQLLTLLQKG